MPLLNASVIHVARATVSATVEHVQLKVLQSTLDAKSYPLDGESLSKLGECALLTVTLTLCGVQSRKKQLLHSLVGSKKAATSKR